MTGIDRHAMIGVAMIAAATITGRCPAMRVTLTEIDGTQVSGSFEGIASSSINLRIDELLVQTPVDRVIRLQFATAGGPAPFDADCTVHLPAGGRLTGKLLDGREEKICVGTSISGRIELPFSTIAAIEFHSANQSVRSARLFEELLASRAPGNDVLITAGDDQAQSLRGALLRLGPDGGEFVFDGQQRNFRIAKAAAIVFAAAPDGSDVAPVMAGLTNGDLIPGRLAEASAEVVRIDAVFGETLDLPVAAINAIDMQSDRLQYLSDLTPETHATTGIVQNGWSYRENRNVFNRPITLGGRLYEKGLGVHSRCELSYKIEGQFKSFVATIGIDDEVRPAGDVVFTVLADGRTVFDGGPVTGRDDPRDIHVNIEGAACLTLIVDFGDNADVGDWADWADARLIKVMPSSWCEAKPVSVDNRTSECVPHG